MVRLAAIFLAALFVGKQAQASTTTAVHSFSGSGPAAAPLVLANDGNYYGIGDGVFYKLTSGGTYTSIATWSGGSPSSLIKGSDGNLYGTTWDGGAYGYGSVFEVTLTGTQTTLVDFTDGSDGNTPNTLLQALTGEFYGTTYGGGDNDCGTVFELDNGSSTWALTTIEELTTTSGKYPVGLILASDGYLYCTAQEGGTNNEGTLVRFEPWGTSPDVLVEFGGAPTYPDTGTSMNGAFPSYLIEAESGKFIGMTDEGGYYGRGVMFTYSDEDGFSTWFDIGGTDTDLSGPGTGQHPAGAPVLGSDGYFYGVMKTGGSSPSDVDGGGIIYRLSFNFSSYIPSYDILYNFNSANTVGALPVSGLMFDGAGHFYGTTTSSSHHSIFKFTP